MPPPFDAVNFSLRAKQTPLQCQQGRADFSLFGTFYFEGEAEIDKAEPVGDICSRHTGEIAGLIDQCEQVAGGQKWPHFFEQQTRFYKWMPALGLSCHG